MEPEVNNIQPPIISATPQPVAQPVIMPQPEIPVPQAPQAGVVYAGFLLRAGAFTLDILIIVITSFTVSFILLLLLKDLDSWIVNFFVLTISLGYPIYFTGKKGQTFGKMALGIKVVRVDGSESVGYINAFLREIVGKFISQVFLNLGFLWMLWDPKKQTWHDKIAKTIVIKV